MTQIIPGSDRANIALNNTNISHSPSLSQSQQQPPSPSSSNENPKSSTIKSKAAQAGGHKAKRSRVTPEQLVHLERFFAKNRTPSVVERKELSEQLGMQERQTQIWFQNRRAKQKSLECKNHDGSSSPPPFDPFLNLQLEKYLHEDEPVTIIPCSELRIGSWKRTADATELNDLITYVSYPKRRLFWYLRSSGQGFRIGVPFEDIIRTQFTPMPGTSGAGCASIYLKRLPQFYMEQTTTGRPHWVDSVDWSEGLQASATLKHELVGPTIELARLLRGLRVNDNKVDHAVSKKSRPRSVGWSTPDLAMWQNPNIQAWDLSHHLHPPISPAPIDYPSQASYSLPEKGQWDHIPRRYTSNDTPSGSPISLHADSWSPILRKADTANKTPSPQISTSPFGISHSDFRIDDLDFGTNSTNARGSDFGDIENIRFPLL